MKKITKVVLGLTLVAILTTVVVHKENTAKKETAEFTPQVVAYDPGGGRP